MAKPGFKIPRQARHDAQHEALSLRLYEDIIMPSYMYILECADGSFYTGSTKNLEVRLWQHQNGEGANYTKKRLPVKLVYCEPYDRVEDAFLREKQVQGWSRRKKMALIEGNEEGLIEFSRNYTQYKGEE